jgi:hypothetical protein
MWIPSGICFRYRFHLASAAAHVDSNLESATWKLNKKNIFPVLMWTSSGICFRCGFHLVSVPYLNYHLESVRQKLRKKRKKKKKKK